MAKLRAYVFNILWASLNPSAITHLRRWSKVGFSAPAPQLVKNSIFARYIDRNSVCIETGTYLGTSTAVLANLAKKVISIEPHTRLHIAAQKRLKNFKNIELILGSSEDLLRETIKETAKREDNISFWLDGHYSGGETYKSALTTPIVEELKAIEDHKDLFAKIVVLIDDARLFRRQKTEADAGTGYPPLERIINWAYENQFEFDIEMDVIVLTHSK